MRISCTTLDQFRLFGKEDWMDERKLEDAIRGVFRPTPEILAGMAFEDAVRRPDEHRELDRAGQPYYRSANIIFPPDAVEQVAQHFDPRGVWQPKDTLRFRVCDQDVTLVVKADHAYGAVIDELKTRWNTFDIEKYMDAFQPRWYLLGFGASYVQYTVAVLRDPEEPRLVSVERFRFYPYPTLRDDCLSLLTEFVEYVLAHGLEKYLADDRYDHLRKGAA